MAPSAAYCDESCPVYGDAHVVLLLAVAAGAAVVAVELERTQETEQLAVVKVGQQVGQAVVHERAEGAVLQTGRCSPVGEAVVAVVSMPWPTAHHGSISSL